MIFIRALISMKEHNIAMLIKIQKSEKDEPPISIFPIETTNSLTCLLINHCHHNKSQQTFIILFYI